jgi:hypothetical protein
MTVKELKELLDKYPENVEVLLSSYGEYQPFDYFESEFSLQKIELHHCNYTTKWQSNIDSYSLVVDICEYKDEIDGKIVLVKVPMERKEFVILVS